jgi:peptide/nickel transport system permease protein
MSDRKIPESEFIDENSIMAQPSLQVIATPGADIPQNSDDKKVKRRVDQTYWSLVKHQYKKNKLAVAAIYVVCFLVFLALFADFLANSKPIYCTVNGESYFPVFKEYAVDMGVAKWDQQFLNVDWKTLQYGTAIWPPIRFAPSEVDLFNTSAAPSTSTGHYLGTDAIGRDVLAGLIHGSRVSLLVGFLAAGVAIIIGVILGSLAGYYGGKTDLIIMRFVEVMQLFPAFFLIITIVALYGSSIWYIMLAIGLTSWTGDTKLVRGEILKVRSMDYVQAAVSLGLSNSKIIFRHVLPNAIAPVLISASFQIAGAILAEASLSFLGFGVAATKVTWGSVLSEARGATSSWWLAIFPGFMIFLTVVAYNLVGEGLRDALDPRLRD